MLWCYNHNSESSASNKRFSWFSIFYISGWEYFHWDRPNVMLISGSDYTIYNIYLTCILGSLGILWYIVWELTIYDKPESHPGISMNEKMYIEKSIGSKPFDPLVSSIFIFHSNKIVLQTKQKCLETVNSFFFLLCKFSLVSINHSQQTITISLRITLKVCTFWLTFGKIIF